MKLPQGPKSNSTSLSWLVPVPLAFAMMLMPGAALAKNAIRVVYSFEGGTGGQSPGNGIIQDRDGNLIGGAGGGLYNGGIIYKLSPAGIESVLHNFGDTGDGAFPDGGLITDKQGNIYGTTYLSGPGGFGGVFKFTPDGHYTLLCSFAGGADGGYPSGTLTLDADGNLYGTASGGANDAGVVFKVAPDGSKTTLYSFSGTDGGDPGSAQLAIDKRGNLYGTTAQGGNGGHGVIFKLTPKGKETVLHTFDHSDGETPNAGLVADKDGNFYGTTSGGGANLSGTVFKFSLPDQFTVLYSFAGGDDGSDPVAGVTLDKSGKIYGTTSAGGASNDGTVFELSPDGTRTLNLSLKRAKTGAPPTGSLALDRRGNVYGTSYYGGAKGLSDSGTVFKVKN